MGRIRDVIRGREENWHSQELLVLSSQPSMYSFLSFLFGSHFKLPDTSTRAVHRTSIEPLPRFAFRQTLAPPALSFAFFHGHFFTHTRTLGTDMLTHTQDTHSHTLTFRYTHVLPFVGFLRGVPFENKDVPEGGRFEMKCKQRGGLATW